MNNFKKTYCNFYLYTLITFFLLISEINLFAQTDLEDGPVKIYYPNGQVSSEGIIKDGNPDGYWKTYYVTGIQKSEGKRTNFALDSTWRFYNQSGELTEVINYQNGKKSGFTEKYIYNNPNAPGQKTLISKELYIDDKREGTSFYYYPTGELKEEISYIKGQKQGYSKEFDRDSTIVSLVQYKDNYMISRERINRKDEEGFKQGRFKEFYSNGNLKIEENFLDDVLHGYYREFDPTGKLLQTLRYERGVIIEEIDEEAKELLDFKRSFDEQGRLVFSGAYKDGVAIGIHRFFDTTGVVMNSYLYNNKGIKIAEGIIDEQGNRKGLWKDFYVSGELKAKGNYLNNRRSGDWDYYFRNGRTEQKGYYIDGRFDGTWNWYYNNGNVWIEESYFNGREDGYSTEYDKEGNVITEGNYIGGEKDGLWKYKVGDHTEEGEYMIGLREDKWTYYFENGKKKFEGNYSQGNPDGRQIYYFENGKIKEEQYYKMGIRENVWRKYDEEGNVVLSIRYKLDREIWINGIRARLPESDIKLIR